MNKVVFLVAIVLNSMIVKAHPVHVSIINLDIDSTGHELTLSIRLFYDDFQMIVNHIYETDINFESSDSLKDEHRKAVSDYINNYLKFSTDSEESVHLVIDSYEKKDNTVWFYLSGKIDNSYNQLIMQNGIMADIFWDQKNMLIYHYRNREEGLVFDRNNTEQKITLHDN